MRAWVGLVLLACACVVRVEEPRPRMVRAAEPMTYNDAVALGTRDCQARGVACFLKSAHNADGLWRVMFDIERGPERGFLHLEYDAWSRALVRADEKMHGHGEGHEHGVSPISH